MSMADPTLFAEVESVPAGAMISEIAPLRGNPNLRRIKVAGKLVARLPASDVMELGLEVGDRWSASVAKRVHEVAETARALRIAFALLGKRGMSRGELIDRIVRRGFAAEIAERLAADLEANHWIDDESYARALAEELANGKSASFSLIVEKLRARKIDESLARRTASLALADINPIEQAVALAKQKRESMKGVPPKRAASRIAGALTRRGYDDETVREALIRVGIDVD
jgi:regulatory protein